MEIVNERPPIYDRAAETFVLTGNELFAYGDKIYNPGGINIPEWLIDHEKVHAKQHEKFGGPEAWWDRYLIDPEFRYHEELEAHQVEYRSFCLYNRDRNKRVRYLMLVARRLASPMYGSIVSLLEAKRRIKQ